MPAAKLGLGYAYAGLKRLVDIVGQSFAKEIFFTARQFNAQEAYAMGLVNRVVPAAELEACVKSITDMICANAPLTIKAVKFTVGEILKDEIQTRRGAGRADGRGVLRQPRLYRGPHRIHGKAQAGLYRDLTAAVALNSHAALRHSSEESRAVIAALLAPAVSTARQATKPSGRTMTAPDGDNP